MLEKLAAEAASHDSLGGFNLLAARKTLTELLAEIGRTAEFSTYTRHDITHIDTLLKAADWIIPKSTFATLTVADALVITLSIYVHDLGMLVTKEEYNERATSDFPVFKDEVLNDQSDKGIDFRDRLSALQSEDHEHFLYEEFVRVHHAERIEAWISGKSYKKFGASHDAAKIVREVFSPLDQVIKSDIALVARSHHLDDLDDLTKYRVNRKYGSSEQDTANIHYAALILRTADLLHITRDRTPVVQFRLASPSDPLGQREWQKQQSVRAVEPQSVSEGQSAVVDVHATFEKAEGFFALMEYLDYCETQLKLSAGWALGASLSSPRAANYLFPWTSVDRSQIEAEGFDPHQFTFSFDQQKVLELLTGHTLYNDAGVAIRELVQNSIDAVRLQKSKNEKNAADQADITVSFDSETRTLRVLDHGVGMSQKTIEDHFLKVGSSSYQTKTFKEAHPNFTSISRFGIGVLSAFMIADEVRVATVSSAEPTGRELVLKSVHGRYLIKNFDEDSEYAKRIGTHGTEIELKLRASSNLEEEILSLLRKWIIVPGCKVECIQDQGEPVLIGAENVQSALESLVSAIPYKLEQSRITLFSRNGIEVAIAQVWNSTYKEWEVLRLGRDRNPYGDPRPRTTSEKLDPISGVSIQGVRVTESLPGFSSDGPIMLVDVTGANAPTTNVARTDLEAGPALEELTRAIYGAVVDVVQQQIPDMTKRISKRFALKEATHLYSEATSGERGSLYTKEKLFKQVLTHAPLHAVEVAGQLQSRSSKDLEESGFTVLIGPAADDAARFLDWLPKPKGLLTLLQDGGILRDVDDEAIPLLGGQSALFAYDQLLWESFEPTSIRSLERGTSLLLTLEKESDRWSREHDFISLFLPEYRKIREYLERPRERMFISGAFTNRYCLDESLDIEGLEDTDVVFVGGYRLFLPHTEFAQTFGRIKKRLATSQDEWAAGEMATLLSITEWIDGWPMTSEGHERLIDPLTAWLSDERRESWPEKEVLLVLARSVASLKTWTSTSAWQRRGDQGL